MSKCSNVGGGLYLLKCSIVMSCYNGEKYLLEQLVSLEHQTRKPNEILIVDDCSSDATVSVVEDYMKNTELNIRFYKHNENRGYIKSFYELIIDASGDVLFLADQDDVWENRKVEYMMDRMERNDKILALNSGYRILRDGKIHKNIGIVARKRHYSIYDVLRYNISMGCTAAFRREICGVVAHNYDKIKELMIPHDLVLNCIAAASGGLYFTSKKLIRYRIHSQNTIGFSHGESTDERIAAYAHLIEEKKELGKLCRILERRDCEVYIGNINESYKARIRALEENKISSYVRNITQQKNYNYCKISTILYDIGLILTKGN